MLSYARPSQGMGTDHEPIKRFFDDLCGEIGYIASGLKEAEAAAFDQEMPLGVLWQRRLSYFLANCRVLVPLLSPPFFESEWCGKEWWVFNQREVVTRPPLKDDESAVVPVIWVPLPSRKMHASLGKLQYTNRHMPDSYAQEGLLALSRRDGSDYRVAVNRIAKRIGELLEYTTIAPGKMVDLNTAPNAFKEPKGLPNWEHVRFWHEESYPATPVQG
jgi:hypothetical protein